LFPSLVERGNIREERQKALEALQEYGSVTCRNAQPVLGSGTCGNYGMFYNSSSLV
jgi:hypothetical protein